MTLLTLLTATGGGGSPPPATDILAPTNLTVVKVAATSVDLRWQAAVRSASTGVAYYKLYVNGVYDNSPIINNIYNTLFISYYKTNLVANTSYTMYITAVDQFGVETAATNTVMFSTPSVIGYGNRRKNKWDRRIQGIRNFFNS